MLWMGSSSESLAQVASPFSFKQTNSDIDAASTTRSASGIMVRSVVRGGSSNVRKLSLEWKGLSSADGSTILNAVKGTFVWVRYLDAQTGALRTARFYVGDRESVLFRYGDGSAPVWETISFNLIER